MYDFIPSEYYRNFCVENNIVFSDREIAAIIWNRNSMSLQLPDKFEKLEAIAAETDDGELKAEIENLTECYKKYFEDFKDNSRGDCIYHDMTRHFFMSFEKAFKGHFTDFADEKFYSKTFRIEKACFSDDSKNPDNVKYGVTFDSFYKKPVLAFPEPEGLKLELLIAPVKFKNPFKRGDIVHHYNQIKKFGVVETSAEEWEELIRKPLPGRRDYGYRNYSEFNSLFTVEMAGTVTRYIFPFPSHNPIIEWEKVENFDEPGLKADFLRCMSDILRGERLYSSDSKLSKLFTLYEMLRESDSDHKL